MNNGYQASIQDTPFHLNYGKHPRLPSDLTLSSECKKAVKDAKAVEFFGNIEKAVAVAKVCLQAAQQHQKKYADEQRIDVQYEVGEMAWLNSQHVTLKAVGTHKLLPKWLGPFRVLAKPSPVNYVLDTPAHYRTHTTFHVSMLRRAYDNGAGVQRPPIIMIEVERLWSCLQQLEPEGTLKRNAPETRCDCWDALAAAVQAAET